MEKENKLTFDQAMQRAETIISELEKAEALSMDDYRRRASEASALLKQCQQQLSQIENQL